MPPLSPLPYHRAILDHLRRGHPRLWQWCASDGAQKQHAEAVRLELLKTTYRLERDHHAALYAAADDAARALGLDAPVTIYQSQQRGDLNASLAYLPGEAHVSLAGPIAETVDGAQRRALFGHELAHFALLETDGRALLHAERLIGAMANDAEAAPSHERTARLWRLYTEVYADRGALLAASGDLMAAVGLLVCVTTGLRDANAESYLRQADEIFAREAATAAEPTHPETFLRARALRLWSESGDGADAEIERMIAGPLALDDLDLLAQARLAEATRALIDRLLAPEWLRTDAVLAHARAYFPDGSTGGPGAGEPLPPELGEPGVADYLCAVLLDFVALAPELEEAPLAAAFTLASEVGRGETMLAAAARELGVPKRRIEAVRRDAATYLREAERR